MFVFGFGSLLWDGWETELGCLSKTNANLKGYRRKFNKASVKNWGTKEIPGPTLNIEQEDSSVCPGLAFEFSEKDQKEILGYLREREGKAFPLQERTVTLEDGREVKAFVPIYEGKNILNESLEELAKKACQAEGNSGKCADYVLNIETKLKALGIEDEEVSKMAELVRGKNNK